MQTRHWMEIWMTMALICYVLAYRLAKKSWNQHLIFAILGFMADMYATYLMTQISFGLVSTKVAIHTGLAFAAILAFFVQAGLGYKAKWGEDYHRVAFRHMHVSFAKFFFLPVWAVAYLTGFLLAF